MAKISEITSSKPFLLYDADFQQPPYVANCWWNKFIKILHHIIGRFIFWYTPCFNMVYTSFLPSTAHSSRPPARNLGCARPPSWMAHSTWSIRLGRHGQVMKATRAKFHQFPPEKLEVPQLCRHICPSTFLEGNPGNKDRFLNGSTNWFLRKYRSVIFSIGTSWVINLHMFKKKLHFHAPKFSMKHHFGHKKVVPFGEFFSRAPCRSKPANFKRFRAASEPSKISWKRVLLVLTSCRQGQIIVEFPMKSKEQWGTWDIYPYTHSF